MQKFKLLFIIILFFSNIVTGEPIIIDHNCTDITLIPESAIIAAKDTLHIAYNHTSHGAQIITGMAELIDFANNGGKGLSLATDIFAYNNGGTNGSLDLHDQFAGWLDCGIYPEWVDTTRSYLDDPNNSDVNVVMWSWCGEVDNKYADGTLWSEYLEPMNQLELDYPNITFVYMTGHVDIEHDANNKAGNDSIRSFCINNDKVLYDFADIERYDPDLNYFEYAHDNCNYYNSSFDSLGNWAIEWQSTHTKGLDWYDCVSAHSQPLNANQKAYAAWWLFSELAGWTNTLDTVRVFLNTSEYFYCDTITIPIEVEFPADYSCLSAELTFTDYQYGMEFIGIDSLSGAISDYNWTYIANSTEDTLYTAFAGSEAITGSGIFCNLIFSLTGEICSTYPITLDEAIFNNGLDTTESTSGSIYIKPIPNYGDIDSNGEIRAYDGSLILKHVVNSENLVCQALANADVDNDSNITNADAVRILQYMVHLIDTLPYTSDNNDFDATGYVGMEPQTFSPGESVQIPIKVENCSNIYGFEGKINYNSDQLSLASISWSNKLNSFLKEINIQDGMIAFAGASSSEFKDDGLFANLEVNIEENLDLDSVSLSINDLRWNNNEPQKAYSVILRNRTSLNPENNLPNKYILKQNYPNPFNPTTSIEYYLPERVEVTLKIYDISGELIKVLVNKTQESGSYNFNWNSEGESSGIYFYQLQAGTFSDTKKMLLIK